MGNLLHIERQNWLHLPCRGKERYAALPIVEDIKSLTEIMEEISTVHEECWIRP